MTVLFKRLLATYWRNRRVCYYTVKEISGAKMAKINYEMVRKQKMWVNDYIYVAHPTGL